MAKNGDSLFLRLYDDSDYEFFKKMWECQYDAAPPRSSLPKTGFVVGDRKLIGFLADTDCDFMICTWYACNPDLSKRDKHEALKKYFMACKHYISLTDKKHLFVYTNYSGIVKMLESLNFNAIEKGHMACKVH